MKASDVGEKLFVRLLAGGAWGASPLPKDGTLVSKLVSLIVEEYTLVGSDHDSIEIIPGRRGDGFMVQIVSSSGGRIVDVLEYEPARSISAAFRDMIRIYEDHVAWHKLSPEEQQRILDED